MASDTVPAVPGPATPDTPDAGGIPGLPDAPARPAGGWLASALAPVDPARPASGFDLNPTATGLDGALPDPGSVDLNGAGSSASFHDGDQAGGDGGTKNNSSQETRVWRAWLLAGAERWRKGADARNKALDIQKAKAQAYKEARTVTVNRSEKNVGGSTSTGTSNNSGKSSSTKTSSSGGGPKTPNGAGGGRSGGTSGGSGHGGGAGRGSSGGHHKDTKGTHTGSGSGSGGRGWKDKATHGSGSGAGKQVKNGPAGSGGGKGSHVEHKTARETPPQRSPRTSKTDKDPASPKRAKNDTTGTHTKTDKATTSGSGSSGGSGGAGKGSGNGKTTAPQQKTATCGDASGIDLTKNKNPKKAKDTGADSAGKTPTPGSGGATKPVDLGKKNPDTKGGDKTTPKPGPKAAPKPEKGTPAPAPGGPVIDTKSSRETGYRDGTRIGKAEAHIKAYKHGVRDGRTDIREAADRDKQRLDKAHQQRKQQPPAPAVPPKPPTPDPRTILMKPKEQPVNPTPTSADYHPPQTTTGQGGAQATPVKVDGIDASHLYLGDGAARQYISRGEVRSLKNFERCFTTKADTMTRLADGTKSLEANAAERTKAIAYLMDQVKADKGGEDLVADLLRVQEATTVQAGTAAELHKRTVRGADNTQTLLANVETRYGGMYQAVVDSPLTQHAEASYYRK